METLQQLMVYSPAMIAYIVLLIAAAGKVGKEKGAAMFLVGAICLLSLSIVMPLFYAFAFPKLISVMDISDMRSFHLIVGLVNSLLWAGAITVLAIGVFQRTAPASRNVYIPPVPIEHQAPPTPGAPPIDNQF